MRGIVNNPVTSVIYHSFYNYPAPINFTYFWNFGVYAFVCLFIQIISGIVLAMHYIPDVTLAFFSIEHIMRDVNYGWLIRYVHANGASMFFIVVYIHIFRGLFFGSFIHPRELLWIVGVFILLLMIITAFLGYVLPWGQMSFWGATVITNLFSAIPKIGNSLVIWLWGGYSVGGPTLQRFFSFHFFLPFIILVFSIVHIVFLHQFGSNNPLGLSFQRFDYLMFYPYYIIKDLFGLILFFIFFAFIVFFYPNILGHPDNYIIANPLSTPTHITPEWYFLPFYAILRSIPSKLFGVSALGFAIISLFFVPVLLFSETRSLSFKPFSQILFWVFFVNCIVLTWIGSLPVKYPFIGIGQILTLYYFIHFFVVGPFVLWFEQALLLMILERNLIILNTGQNIFCLLVFFFKKKNNAEFSTK